MIRVQLWGTRGSITTPGPSTQRYGGNTPCVEVIGFDSNEPGAASHLNNPHLILDAGTGIIPLQTKLMQGPCGQGQGTLRILLSHYHWDHVIGLPFFKPMFRKGNQISFYGTSINDLQDSIKRLFTSAYSPVQDVQNVAATLNYHAINPNGMDIAGFQVQATITEHPNTTFAFRIQYGSQVIVYTPDHEIGNAPIDANLIQLARNANLWIINGMNNLDDHKKHKGWGHSNHIQATELALEANVETAILFHHNPLHDDHNLDKMHREAEKVTAGSKTKVLMGKDGMTLDIK